MDFPRFAVDTFSCKIVEMAADNSKTGGKIFDKASPRTVWGRIWNVVVYAMLAAALGGCLVDAEIPWIVKSTATALSCLWGAWYWGFVINSSKWRDRSIIQGLVFVVSILVAAALSWMNMLFVLLLFSYFGIAFGTLPVKWAIPIVSAASMALAARFMDYSDVWYTSRNLLILLGFSVMAFFAVLLGLFVDSVIRQSRGRQRMIDELKATRSELARKGRETGVLAERQRLAGEIHDTLVQGFTSIVLQLETAEFSFLDDPSKARVHMLRALNAARDNLTEARSVLRALRPEVLEREPFETALGRIVQKWEESTGIRAELTVTAQPVPLSPQVEIALMRAAQEALMNVHKHARADRVSLTLSYMGDVVILDVQDDGQGFGGAHPTPQNGMNSKGYGLIAMRERVSQLGGQVAVETAPDEGTTLVVEIPLQHAGQEKKI